MSDLNGKLKMKNHITVKVRIQLGLNVLISDIQSSLYYPMPLVIT